MAANYGLLIDYEFCSGCHSCEMACKVAKDLNEEQFGIKLEQIGPWAKPDGGYMYRYYPVPTDVCDLCADRVAAGKLPSCVHHCQASVMRYGTLDELAEELKRKPNQMLFALR